MVLSADGRYITAAEKKYQTDRYRCMYDNTVVMAIHGGFRRRGPGFLYTLFGWRAGRWGGGAFGWSGRMEYLFGGHSTL